MRLAGISGVHRRRQHGCTRRDAKRQPQPDLVQRNFVPTGPDRLWVADLTQHNTGEGRLYLATVLDAFSRRVIGWAMAPWAETELAVNALDMALRNRQPGKGVIHHSDHGAQYTSLAFTKRLEQTGLVGSMGSVGDALDNALVESFYATLQTELLDRSPWPTRQRLATEIFSYIEVFYNRERRHSALDYLTPDEYDRKAAGLHPTLRAQVAS